MTLAVGETLTQTYSLNFSDCRLLSEPTNGFTDNLNVRQETIVIFDCDSGYTLFGDDVLLCQSNATWNSTEPTCEKGKKKT